MILNYSGFIYEWTNVVNGKKYIGSHRGTDTDGYIGSGTAFLKAYKKYGRENFIREILEYVNDTAEIKIREEFYLKNIDAKNNRMYYNLSNTPTGGYEHIDWTNVRIGWHNWADKMLKKSVYQFDLLGNLIQKFNSLTDAANAVGTKNPSNIKYTCEGKFNNAHGYIWSYHNEITKDTLQKPENTKCKKKVSTPDGIFESVTEVVKYYNFTSSKMVRDRCLSDKEKWKQWSYIFKQ